MKGIYTRLRNSVEVLRLHCRAWSLELYLGLLSGVRGGVQEVAGRRTCWVSLHCCWVGFEKGVGFLPMIVPRVATRPFFTVEILPCPSSGFFFLQSVGDPIVPKFDMHIYTSVPTVDEVNNLIKEYAVPLDLRPGVPPSTLTMNNLPEDKIVATSMSQFLKFLMSKGICIGKGTALAANEHEDERVLAVQRKAQAAKEKAVGKRSAAGGASRQTKRKKTAPMSFTLSDSEPDDFTRSGSGTHHSAPPLTIIIPNDTEPADVGSNLALESANRPKHSAHSDEDTHTRSGGDGLYHDERGEHARRHAFGSTGRMLSSSSGGSARLVLPQRNPGGDGIGSSIRADVALVDPFVQAWNLTTQSILNDDESCQDMMINLVTVTLPK
ncbi:hypothetical protein Tco_0949654 [Tanacetum coccineum]